MTLRLFGVVALAVICLSASADAQSIAPLRLGAALGTSFDRTHGTPFVGGHAVLSLTSHRVGSRLGIRVEALFDGAQRTRRLFDNPIPLRFHTSTIGLTISPVYRVWRGLYVIAGVGVYQTWYESQLYTSDAPIYRTSSTELGVNAGLGIDFKLFGRDAFAESRLYSAAFRDRIPFSLGIRF
jgi:hypothetical protein